MFSRETVDGVATFSVIESLCRTGESGVLTCTGDGFEKRVRFWRGRVTSADSTLIDDRMGEIIYRKGMLTLDEFAEAAAKVSKEVRFGEALIRSGVFTPIALWDALATQTREIVGSLCFYPKLDLAFQEGLVTPKIEYPIHHQLSEVMNAALYERSLVRRFSALLDGDSHLTLDPRATALANNDFRRDMVDLIGRSSDYKVVVQTDSRLSPIYSERAVFELFALGVVQDTHGFWASCVPEGLVRDLHVEVESVNFMFAELAGAAQVEGVDDWGEIVASADVGLRRVLGAGTFLDPAEGFRLDNIVRAAVCHGVFRESIPAQMVNAPDWLEAATSHLREVLFSAVLQIHFELLNRKITSPEFMRVKEVICELRKNPS